MSKRHHTVETDQVGSQGQAKLIVSIVIVLSGVVAYYMLGDQPLAVRAGVLLLALGVGGYLFYLAPLGQRWWGFLQETRKELRLVVWPTRKETLQTTIMIVIVVIVMGIFLWLVDMFFLWAIQWLTGRGG